MKSRSQMRPTWPAMLLALAATMAMLLGMVGPSNAERAHRADKQPTGPNRPTAPSGRTVPVSKISIQLWTFSRYIGGSSFTGAPADAPTTGSTTAERLKYVLAYLSKPGFRNIEPYSFHGLTAEQFKALADEYGLKVLSRHMSTNVATWEANLADASLLGQRYTGSGGFAAPGISSYQHPGHRRDAESAGPGLRGERDREDLRAQPPRGVHDAIRGRRGRRHAQERLADPRREHRPRAG